MPNSIGYCGSGVDLSYGCSDIAEVISWLLNEDTEAADVIILGSDNPRVAINRRRVVTHSR